MEAELPKKQCTSTALLQYPGPSLVQIMTLANGYHGRQFAFRSHRLLEKSKIGSAESALTRPSSRSRFLV